MKSAAHALDGQLRRGVVLKLQESDLDDERYQGGGVRRKYCVVLNVRPLEDPVIYVHSTTNLDAFGTGEWDTDILRIPAGHYSFLPEDTVISLRTPKRKSVAELRALMDKRQLDVCGELSEEHMRELNVKIRCSSLLTPATLKRISP